MSVSLVLVDDHLLFRASLRVLLASEPGLSISGEAADAREAYRTVEEHKPDVVLLDIALPGVNGVSITRELVRRDPRCKILVLTQHSSEDFVAQALAAGALGYALKHQQPREIVDAIHAVAHGDRYLCPRLQRGAVEELLRLKQRGRGTDGPCDALSVREREIFDLLVRGYSNGDIAAQLCISIKTVETHRAHVLKKLGAHSMVELLRFAARHGLLHD
jgi:two-component system, NarL family, response regulator NreC